MKIGASGMKKKKAKSHGDRDQRNEPERRKAYRRMKKAGGAESGKKIKDSEYNDMVKQRAFKIYRDRVINDLPGDDLQDWFQAEEEMEHADIME
jgi:hypothetical protein